MTVIGKMMMERMTSLSLLTTTKGKYILMKVYGDCVIGYNGKLKVIKPEELVEYLHGYSKSAIAFYKSLDNVPKEEDVLHPDVLKQMIDFSLVTGDKAYFEELTKRLAMYDGA